MSLTKTLVGRRNFLIATGMASAGALTTHSAMAVGQAATAICPKGANQATTIKGIVAQKPLHTTPPLEVMMGVGEVMNGMIAPAKATPAVYVENGKLSPGNSKAGDVTAGNVGDKWASGVKITANEGDVGGVFVKGLGTEYLLADSNIDLSGDGIGSGGLGPAQGCGAGVEEGYATLTIRNCTITTSGQFRNATSVTNHGILKVYNSTLTAHGAPFTPDMNTKQMKLLGVDGNSRCHVTMGNSYSYFYYCTIISGGWGALSMDDSDGFSYQEVNHCKVRTITSGYGTYSDRGCHNFINSCDFDVASMAGILEGEAELTFKDTKAKCGSHFALFRGRPGCVGTLSVTGGDIVCKSEGILAKSGDADILLDGVKFNSESGILLKSAAVVDEPDAALAAPTKGEKVFGIHATLRNMDVTGDVVHTEDMDNRSMTVYLEGTTLKGAIKDAAISMNQFSKWVATADSNVTIVGEIDVSQIDAPPGVTITAVAGQSGTYKLASCGTLILKAV